MTLTTNDLAPMEQYVYMESNLSSKEIVQLIGQRMSSKDANSFEVKSTDGKPYVFIVRMNDGIVFEINKYGTVVEPAWDESGDDLGWNMDGWITPGTQGPKVESQSKYDDYHSGEDGLGRGYNLGGCGSASDGADKGGDRSGWMN